MNSKKLKAEMLIHEKTVDDICAVAGFGRSAWFRKINGMSQFTQSEISAISDLLGLDLDKIGEIFFEDLWKGLRVMGIGKIEK